ncbi:class I SAM-dependent methyltransferase [Phytoactinopolyspora halotolerans]|uniref:Methyltransferase domain-containing protein n=1 Tax=Phytoactinopolyspora halotolerans TaxID=1981512 RepID=A0A6L9SGY9_9ACTN|nr:class I SAM-dependent methyltransferase [Phytoactinopolyspora halotolerans]NEE03868.1 methyltransferase domain-containing protein [Phytoactinopolyspora halotolerans]
MDLAVLRVLASAEGAPLLDEATRSYGVEDEFTLGSRLRREHPSELVAAALTQARLRRRAIEKFAPADAARMLFTVDGYEQATRAPVAEHRAARIAGRISRRDSSRARVLDLCTGIGADLIAFARAGLDVTGIEIDEVTAEVGRHNLTALGLQRDARVHTADATSVERSGYDVVFCDPARRTTRGRVFDPDSYRPAWPFIQELLEGTACVKVAPGIPHDRVPTDVEAEWVSVDGEVKEAALWAGALAEADPDEGPARRRVRRRATLLTGGRTHTLTDVDDPGEADVRAPGRFLYEPDGAVIRAGLVTAVARSVDGWLVDPSIAYVGSDTRADLPFARGYEITDALPYDVKRLRRYVREHQVGILTIKKRGVDVTPESLRKTLRPRGTAAATLIVTRVQGKATVLVARPLLV